MKVISFFNNKGGVGKTTLTCNLASVFAKEFSFRILVIDCDPQCNATVLILGEDRTVPIYWKDLETDDAESDDISTLLDVLKPIEVGDSSVNQEVNVIKSNDNRFSVDLLPGHPRLSIIEDRLSQAWQKASAGDIGGLRQTNWCSIFCNYFKEDYDAIFLDLGPSLGSLNRAALLGSDYFVTPMAADIFSIIGLRNISSWLHDWLLTYERGIIGCDQSHKGAIEEFRIRREIPIKKGFAGYTIQAYIAKYTEGKRRPTKAFERIIETFPREIDKNLGPFTPPNINPDDRNLGEVPNMYSLVPLAQAVASPIGDLRPSDGIIGTHYSQAQKYKKILIDVASALERNIRLHEV